MDGTDLIGPVIEGAVETSKGLGSAILPTFQSWFMVGTTADGVTTYSGLNDVGVALLTLVGMALGIGIFWWVGSLIARRRKRA